MESYNISHPLQEQAITRGLRGVTRHNKLPETYDRILFYRNPNNPHEIKVIHRTYNHQTKDFKNKFESNFHVAEPPAGAKEISELQARTFMRMHEPTPFRYGNK